MFIKTNLLVFLMFLKTCFSCGAKVKDLYEGNCEECFKKENPPISELKQINFKICNMSKKICYKSVYYDQEKIFKMMPDIIKKHLIINPHYILKDFQIENFEIEGHKVRFDLEVDCDLK